MGGSRCGAGAAGETGRTILESSDSHPENPEVREARAPFLGAAPRITCSDRPRHPTEATVGPTWEEEGLPFFGPGRHPANSPNRRHRSIPTTPQNHSHTSTAHGDPLDERGVYARTTKQTPKPTTPIAGPHHRHYYQQHHRNSIRIGKALHPQFGLFFFFRGVEEIAFLSSATKITSEYGKSGVETPIF